MLITIDLSMKTSKTSVMSTPLVNISISLIKKNIYISISKPNVSLCYWTLSNECIEIDIQLNKQQHSN